eukprot:TRINITY_DN19086_c0_g1_i1.p1 TRINITY_DN19086_c0_g1~~TRINITY_DN19086_c0_g1_i1.p1  ORF type:complete len:368 (+),score=143.55 TRINITY_DN19086_c0_g1_i1:101-1204(+)
MPRGETGESPLELLPDDVIELVLLRLPSTVLAAVSACCTRLRRLASSDAVWRSLYAHDFPRGRTSFDRCCRDVYVRAMRSLPNSDVVTLEPLEFDAGIDFVASSIALGRDGQCIVACDCIRGLVRTLEPDGTLRSEASLADVVRVLADPTSERYFAFTETADSHVHVLDADLRVLRSACLDDQIDASSVVVDPTGRLYAINFVDRDVVVVDPESGAIARKLDIKKMEPSLDALAVDSRGCLLVSGSGCVTTFDPNGRRLSEFEAEHADALAVSRDGVVVAFACTRAATYSRDRPGRGAQRSGRKGLKPSLHQLVFYSSIGRELRRVTMGFRLGELSDLVWADDGLLVCRRGPVETGRGSGLCRLSSS